MAHDVTEQARAARLLRDSERRLMSHLDGMKDLHEVGNLCARAGVDRGACLTAILNAAIRISDAQKGTIQLLDGPTASLVIAAQRGFEPRFLGFFARVGADDVSACAAALRLGHRVVVEDVERSELFAGQPAGRELLEAGVRAVQSVPLVSSDGLVVGMISTHFERPHLPDERALRLIDVLARQAADYLQRLRVEASLRSREAELETVINRTPFMLTRCGRDLRYRFVSAAYARMLRREPHEITGRLIVDIMGDEAFAIIRPHIERVLAGEPVEYRADLPLAGTGHRSLAVFYSPETDGAGRVDGWIASILDVTDRDPLGAGRAHEQRPAPEIRVERPSPAVG
jgi:PAS domain-containing protein